MTAASVGPSRWAPALRGIGWLGIATIATARCLTSFAAEVRFDIDPALDPSPLASLGPAGSLALDTALLLACAAALLGETLERRHIDWLPLLLALLPAPIIALHAATDAGDLWRGSTWLAAAVAGAAVAQLVRRRSLRIATLAVLAALTAPLATRGAMQMTVEHADTVAAFEARRDEFLGDRGWAPDSAAARIYERRLRQARPRGWFTTTNILAAVMLAGGVVGLGLTIGAVRARLSSGWIGAAALLTLTALGGVVASGSKGAILAGVIGAGLVAMPLVIAPLGRGAARWGPLLLVAVVLAAPTAVLIRGVALHEGFAGERSLLFRWHYTAASARIFIEHPLHGVGPDGYQRAYTQARDIRNPEEVTSSHSISWDWLSTLGATGTAWIALVLLLLWRAGRALRAGASGDDDPDAASRGAILGGLAAAALAFPLALSAEVHVLGPQSATARLLGAGAFMVVVALVGRVAARVPGEVARWSVAAAAAALLMHAHIEMTFFEPGSVVWAMCLLGLAGGRPDAPPAVCRPVGAWLLIAAVLSAAAWTLVAGAVPARRQQARVNGAAAALQPFPGERRAQVACRLAAADGLLEAHAILPTNIRPADAAIRQLLLAAEAADGEQRRDILAHAVERATALADGLGSATTLNLAVNAAVSLAVTTGRGDDWTRAADLARRMTLVDPQGLFAWRRYGDVLWQAGRRDEAVTAYRRAIEIDAQLELDPLKQMSQRARERVEQRISSRQP